MASPNAADVAFPFLQLPPEIRSMIYLLALPTDPVQPRGPKSTKVHRDESGQWRRTTPWTPPPHPSLNIFLACRQFHQEASHLFYNTTHFVIKISRPSTPDQGARTQFQNPRFESPEQWKPHYERVRHIDLDLSWDCSYPASTRLHLFQPSRILANFRNLRSVTVKFSPCLEGRACKGYLDFVPPSSLGESDVARLLRSLMWLRRRCPDLAFRIETFGLGEVDGKWVWRAVNRSMEECVGKVMGVGRRPAGQERSAVSGDSVV